MSKDEQIKLLMKHLRDAGVWHYGLPRTVRADAWNKFRWRVAENLLAEGWIFNNSPEKRPTWAGLEDTEFLPSSYFEEFVE